MIGEQEFCPRFQNAFGRREDIRNEKKNKKKKSPGSGPESVERRVALVVFSLPLLMNAEVIRLSEEESRGEA